MSRQEIEDRYTVQGDTFVKFTPEGAAKRGYPERTVMVGRMTKAEIMEGGEGDVVEAVKTAHNEITRTLKDGTVICRLRETDIVTLYPDGAIKIDTGGWNTVTTKRHIHNFLESRNFPNQIRGDSKGGGIRVEDLGGYLKPGGIIFKQYVTVFPDGSFAADIPGGY